MGNYPVNNYSPYSNAVSRPYQSDASSGASAGRPIFQMIRPMPNQISMLSPGMNRGGNPLMQILGALVQVISTLIQLVSSLFRFPSGGNLGIENMPFQNMSMAQPQGTTTTSSTTADSTEEEEGGYLDTIINGVSKIGSLFDKDSKIGGLLNKGYDFVVGKVGGFFSSLF